MVIGYQITTKEHELPDGLFSFQLFRTANDAYKYFYQNHLPARSEKGNPFFVIQVQEGQIENPTYIDVEIEQEVQDLESETENENLVDEPTESNNN